MNDAYAVEFLFNGQKKPKLFTFRYQTDDGASNEVNVLYYGSVNFDKNNNNLMLEGNKKFESKFASTGFVRDGMHKDYITDSIIDARNQALLFMGLAFIATAQSIIGIIVGVGVTGTQLIVLRKLIDEWITRFGRFTGSTASKYTGAVRLKMVDTVNVPRILDWDGVNMRRAKVSYVENPTPNPKYNDQPKLYKSYYPGLLKKYKGFDLAFNYAPDGGPNYRAFNYSEYFEPYFENNLFQYHEATINANMNIETNQSVKWKSCASANLKNKFGLYEGQICKVGKIIKVYAFGNYSGYARVTSIELVNDELLFTGKLLRR
jgi:hypothetical protein